MPSQTTPRPCPQHHARTTLLRPCPMPKKRASSISERARIESIRAAREARRLLRFVSGRAATPPTSPKPPPAGTGPWARKGACPWTYDPEIQSGHAPCPRMAWVLPPPSTSTLIGWVVGRHVHVWEAKMSAPRRSGHKPSLAQLPLAPSYSPLTLSFPPHRARACATGIRAARAPPRSICSSRTTHTHPTRPHNHGPAAANMQRRRAAAVGPADADQQLAPVDRGAFPQGQAGRTGARLARPPEPGAPRKGQPQDLSKRYVVLAIHPPID